MSNKKIMYDEIYFDDQFMCVDLWYPSVEDNEIKGIQIGLMDVRAADDIRILYDYDRDGWVIQQASIFSWDDDSDTEDQDWQEVAFIKAWQREKK